MEHKNTEVDNYLVDAIQSVAIHNGIAIIVFMRMDTEGRPLPAVELNLPMNQAPSITHALSEIS